MTMPFQNFDTVPLCKNIEVKAKVRDFEGIFLKAKELSGKDAIILNQTDTFYKSHFSSNYLKLREEDGSACLISYTRPELKGPKCSKYKKCQVSNPGALAAVLKDALEIRGLIKKQRFFFLVGQTRIHIDKVEGLGSFMELEVMLRDDQSEEEGRIIAQELMSLLGIADSDMVAQAYIDILLTQSISMSSVSDS